MTLQRKTTDVSTVQRDILKHLRTAGQRGMTDDEIADALHLENLTTASQRRAGLEKAGLVKELGVTRSINGKMKNVYVVTKEGKDAAD